MIVYDVYTDLDPDTLTEVAKETFRLWLKFALGQDNDLGVKIAHPTGRYAASLSWKKTGTARVSVIADENIAPEALWLETGTDGADMTQMLREGYQINERGLRYRTVPLRPDNPAGPLNFDFNTIAGGPRGERLPLKQGRIWATARVYVDPKSRYRTITEDTTGWMVPPMPAYAPARLLKDMLEQQFGR